MSSEGATLTQLEQTIKDLGRAAPEVQLDADERVRRAKRAMLEGLDSRTAMDLETCVHCGMCAEACHFYESTHDPKYTPIHKAYLLRKVYRRELSPVRLLNKLFLREITAEQLEQWQELVFNSCNGCGRCDMMCPMGIHISKAIGITKNALGAAGFAPPELRALEQEQRSRGTIFGVGAKELDAVIAELRGRGLQIPVDKAAAHIMVLTSGLDLVLYKESFAAIAKILNKLQADWTLKHTGFEAANFGKLSGDAQGQRLQTRRILDAALDCGAKIVLTPECGHAYPTLRWEAPNDIHRSLPFEVMAISEYIGQQISSGRLKVRPIGKQKKVTFQDPCKIGRNSGIFREPRVALEALGVDFREMESHGKTQYCCGGGGGVFFIDAAEPLRRRTFEIKQHQVEDTGADSLVTTCNTCRLSFSSAGRKVNWNKPVESLVELVAANLAD
ncbi:MAG TPA: (Fe-S)-binding protein [Steroidobacteraceae bacterium]